jgi:ribosomal protein L7Ae-like RNA K-turn-binding protein
MPDAAENKIISLLTMCRRAGMLLLGFDAVTESAKQNGIFCVLLAQDCAPRTEKEVRFRCKGLPVRKLTEDMDTLACFFRKRTAVFGISSEGFAKKLLSLLPEQAEEQP